VKSKTRAEAVAFPTELKSSPSYVCEIQAEYHYSLDLSPFQAWQLIVDAK